VESRRGEGPLFLLMGDKDSRKRGPQGGGGWRQQKDGGEIENSEKILKGC